MNGTKKTSNTSLSGIRLIPQLPVSTEYRQASAQPIPEGLVGSKIVAIGQCDLDYGAEGGGLIIDFIPSGSKDVRRVVLEFNECGMWSVGVESTR